MNWFKWMKNAKKWSSRYAVAIFGVTKSGEIGFGSGYLLNFRGSPIFLTCKHVADPIEGMFYISTSMHSYQDQVVAKLIKTDPYLDVAILVPNQNFDRGRKQFYPAQNCLLGGIDTQDSVVVHGFPAGREGIQEGGKFDTGARTARFTSFTYLSVTGSRIYNQATGRTMPTIYWKQEENLSAKTFLPLGATRAKPFIVQGCSGGPVYEASSHRLAGHVTHVDPLQDKRIFYTPIHKTLALLDRLEL